VTKDYVEAYKWLSLGAAQGNANARGCKAELAGQMTPEQIAKGARLAREFNPISAPNSGTSPAKPNETGRELIEIRAKAENGDAQAQFNLGDRYRTGEGVAKDAPEAVKWYRKAAEQGYARGQCALGTCYANGVGLPKDDAEAVTWYRKAAEQGLRRRSSTSALAISQVRE